MVSAISFGWYADFGKTLTIIQRSSQLVYSDTGKHPECPLIRKGSLGSSSILACSADVFWTRECTSFRIRIWQLWRIRASKYFLSAPILVPRATILLTCGRDRELWLDQIFWACAENSFHVLSQSDLPDLTGSPWIADFRCWTKQELSIPAAGQGTRMKCPTPTPPRLLCTNPSPVKYPRSRHRKLYLLSSVPLQNSACTAGYLDLRHVNRCIPKAKFGMKWEGFPPTLVAGSLHVQFDLKSGYHHIDFCQPHQQSRFLGHFCFTILPFGLSSAPFLFTKILRRLVRYWRGLNIHLVLNLDDGAGCEKDFLATHHCSNIQVVCPDHS